MKRENISSLIFGFAVLLIVVGIFAYFVTAANSITALIPAFVGIPMLIAGYATTRPRYRTIGLYAAAGLALLMVIGSFRGISGFISGITGKGEISGAAWLQVVLAVLSILFLIALLPAVLNRGKVKI